jgi:copper chaperone CopZ
VKSYRLVVGGMTCEHCAKRVADALRAARGVREAAVELKDNSAMVVFDESQCGMAGLVEAVRGAGYTVGGFRDTTPPPAG